MVQDFETEELKSALERALGFRLASLRRLDGGCALNFRAEREGDGSAFLVKCSPPERQSLFANLERHLADLEGTKAVRRVFSAECPPKFRQYNLLCLAWCQGKRRFPDTLSDDELRAFLDDYLGFSAAMQKTSGTLPAMPLVYMREAVLRNCRGLGGALLRRMVDELLPADETRYRKERLRIIHGDFHHGNFLFEDGRLSGCFDLEEFRRGYPADDIVRYFVCAAEHLRWYDVRRRRRILRGFSLAVRHLPYPADEWRVAIGGLLLQKLYKHMGGQPPGELPQQTLYNNAGERPPGLLRALNLLFRARLYRRLKRLLPRQPAIGSPGNDA